MRKFCFKIFLFLVSLFPISLAAQHINYYEKANTTITGINLVNGGDINNAQFCKVITRNNSKKFTPHEVIEYGFNNGQTYVARDITVSGMKKRVFLERLAKGKLNLYFYKNNYLKLYFIETDSAQLIEIPQKKGKNTVFRKILAENTGDCANVKDAAKFVSYNKKSMAKFINRYNGCELKPFPHFRYGIFAGYEGTKLIPYDPVADIGNINFGYNGGYSIGVFTDIPLFASCFSLHPELYFSKQRYSYSSTKENKQYDFVANVTSFKLPVLLRYAFPVNKVRPYINAGIILGYNLVSDDVLYESNITNSTIKLNSVTSGIWFNKFQLGGSMGAGVEIALTYRNSLFIEFRYNKLIGSNDSRAFKNSEYNINFSVNF